VDKTAQSSTPPSGQPKSKTAVVTDIRSERRSLAKSAQAADKLLTEQQLARQLAALEENINQLPDIDTARVVALHNRILAGEYEIDAERLAASLMDFELKLDR
jgi:flagellar biosynthesis anti-sigma factor FlgM